MQGQVLKQVRRQMFKQVCFLCGLLICSYVSADWSQIAYDTKYDELEGVEFLNALKTDKKSQILRNLLPKYKDDLTQEEFEFFNLWSAVEVQDTEAEKIMSTLKSRSSRIQLLKAHYFVLQKNDSKAYAEVQGLKVQGLNVEILELYLRLGLLGRATDIFDHLVQTPEPTYNLLGSLQMAQKMDKSTYLRWLESLRLSRPQDDLAHQLWIEVSSSYGPANSANALRDYCRVNKLYCYNTAEYLRQNKSPAEAEIWAFQITALRELTKFKVHSFIDKKNFVAISLLQDDLQTQGLSHEERYAYALYYSLYIQNKCSETKVLEEALLRSSTYRERVQKMAARCRS